MAAMKKQPCHYCGGTGGTIDHRIPKSQGGQTTLPNCVPACQWCNSRKRDRTEEEFRAWLKDNSFTD